MLLVKYPTMMADS